MNIFSRKFWRWFIHEPKILVETLRENNNTIQTPVVEFLLFCRITITEFWANHAMTRASALAFSLLLTLIPLMASLSFMVATFVEVHPKQVEEIVTLFLPFAPPTVLDYIGKFFANAQRLRGIGVGVLVVFAIGFLGTIEESFNTIWKVMKPRSIFNQIITFTMVMVYGPLLFILSFRLPRWLGFLSNTFIFGDVLPFLFLVLAFTVFIWLIPNTRVRFKSAIIGGLLVSILFELEKWGFGTYIRLSIQTRTIYGAYGILPFFFVSLFMLTFFVLFGTEVAFVYQNFYALVKVKSMRDRRAADFKTYLGVRMLVDIFGAFLKKQPAPLMQTFVDSYELTVQQINGVLFPLMRGGYINIINGREAYVPAFDLSQVTVMEVVNVIEEQSRKVPRTPDDTLKKYLSDVLDRMKSAQEPTIAMITLLTLVQVREQDE
jgi:membrane protein